MTDDWADDEADVAFAPPDRSERREKRERRERRARREVAHVRPPDERRLPAVLIVAAALALAGLSGGLVASGVAGGSPVAGVNVVAASPGPVVGPVAATSSAWYCPGPLPIGKKATSSIDLANTSPHSVNATLTITTVPGSVTSKVSLDLPALGTASYTIPDNGNGAMEAAASVLVQGGGVAVAERSSDNGAPTTATCQVAPSPAWLLASGSTGHAADVLVSLFDPTTLPAVVDLTCYIPALPGTIPQAVIPPPLQGITLQPGQMQVVDLGRVVQLKPDLAVAATASSGRVVVGAWTQIAVGRTYYGRLQAAASAPEPDWTFPVAAGPPGQTPVYWLFNPSSTATRVHVALTFGSKESTSNDFSIAATSLAVVSPQVVTTAVPAEITTVAGPGVIAARGYVVGPAAPPARHSGNGKHRAVGPALASSYAPWSALGAVDAGQRWLVFAPPLAAATAAERKKPRTEALYVANTGTTPAAVRLMLLGPTGAGRRLTAVAQPGSTTEITIPAGTATEAVVVEASAPVTVELDLYVKGQPSGNAEMGIPIG